MPRWSRRTFLKTAGVVAGSGAIGTRAGVASAGTAPGRALPPFGQPVHLDVTDIRSLTGDEQAAFTTLQGVVNRRLPRVYYLLQNDTSDAAWLDTMGLPSTTFDDPWKLFARYSGEAHGVIVTDPDVPDTVNLATTMAGLSGAVVATPDLADKLAAKPYSLKVVDDLRGRFSGRIDAYQWALRNLWPRASHQVLTAISPTSTVDAPGVQWTTLAQETQQIRDSSNKDTYTVDLSGQLGTGVVYVRFSDAFPSDGWGPSVQHVTVTADGATIADFQPTTAGEAPYVYDLDNSSIASGGWRFADGGSDFIYQFRPPAGTTSLQMSVLMWNEYLVSATNTAPTIQVAFPVFRDYIVATKSLVFWLDPLVDEEAALFGEILSKTGSDTPYLGWFVGGHESTGVTLCSEHRVPVLAADFYTNGTVLSGARASISRSQPSAPVPVLSDKIYVTLTMSEGDNVQYCEHRLRQIWDDASRGKVPINWSVNPLLADIGPALLHYYQRTQTGNDYFIAGPSGAGYTYPGEWPTSDIDDYTTRTGQYMAATGMNSIYVLNRHNDTDEPLPEFAAKSYQDNARLLGLLYNWESTSQTTVTEGLPIVTQVGIGSVGDGQNALAQAAADWSGDEPLFVALGVLAWNMTPTDVTNLVNSLDSRFSVVRGDVFLTLLRQHLGLG